MNGPWKYDLDAPINIHLTGCPHSCAQHSIGDIGLLGAKVKVAGQTEEGYHLFVGGGYGRHAELGRQLFTGLSMEALKTTLDTMMKVYLDKREPGETFRSFTRRHNLDELQTLFSSLSTSKYGEDPV